MRDYQYPDVLVSTQWLVQHMDDSDLRIVESNGLNRAIWCVGPWRNNRHE